MTEQLTINGMSCGGCVASVKNTLERVGVKDADVEIGSAHIKYDESTVTHDRIVQAIADAGFEVVDRNA